MSTRILHHMFVYLKHVQPRSRYEWLRHMRSKHSMACWKCPFTETGPRCSERRFSTKETLMHHIIQLHSEGDGSITDSQLQILAGINLTTEMTIQQCPICGFRGTEDIQSDLIISLLTSIPFLSKHFHGPALWPKARSPKLLHAGLQSELVRALTALLLQALLHEIVKYLTWFLNSLSGYCSTLTLHMMAADW
jgi:hypothetical protein